MGKKYLNRVNELVRRKVTQLLIEHSNDPRLNEVTITDVNTNRDTSRAEIFYSIIGTPEDIDAIQTVLENAAGWMRSQLAPALRLRNVPQLVFIYDPSLENGDRIEALLQDLIPQEKNESVIGD
ncbi:MAG: 30S ribosome-binding factor RbfA [Anaerolineales bacterium]|nr:MAG: 30S ribosome-binding factor RbfA [Anaerolineales bacterium]